MVQAIRFGNPHLSAHPLADTLRALVSGVAGDGVNAVRDVLATWCAREVLGARDAHAVAALLGTSRVTSWRLLDRLDAACARAGIAAGPARSGFTRETNALSPVKQAPLGGRGVSVRCVLTAKDPESTQNEGTRLRRAVVEEGSAGGKASLEDCTSAAAAKLEETGRLTDEQKRHCLDWLGAQWHRVTRCRGERIPYAVSVAMNRAREHGWLPPRETDGRAAVRALAQGRRCARCGQTWFPGRGCGCPAGGAPDLA